MTSGKSFPNDYCPVDVDLQDHQITPNEAPSIIDPKFLGPKLFAHNALLLLDLIQKESGNTSANIGVSLRDITSNQVVCLLSRQKQRRCKQIHDERLGKVSLILY
jgi:hypothetical protein